MVGIPSLSLSFVRYCCRSEAEVSVFEGATRPPLCDLDGHRGGRLGNGDVGGAAPFLLRVGRDRPQHPLRRPVHVRPRQVQAGAGRLLGRRPAVMGARLSDRRAEPDADHERDQLARRPRRRHERRDARRSGAVQVSDRLHHRGRLVDADRRGSGGAARLSAERRLPDRRRLQGRRLARAAGGGWEPFAANMQRVLPGARFFDIDASHPIFHSFFEIETLDNFPQAYNERHGRSSAACTRTTTRASG